MKFLLKSFVLALALGATSSAFANPVNAVFADFLSDFTVVTPQPQSVSGSDIFCSIFPARCEGKKKYPNKDPEPVAVPELNAAAAPISAAIALSALALGAERRRRRKFLVQRNG